MEIKKVETLTDIKEKSTIVITGDCYKNEPFKVQSVKVTPNDGTEVILDRKKNTYFNVGMYLEGKSWVKECGIIV